jgi:hypothetical protein
MTTATDDRPAVIHDDQGPVSVKAHGTIYPLADLLNARQRLQALTEAARLALAVADAQRTLSGRLRGCASPVARRLLAQLDDAEAQAWAQLGAAVGAAERDDDGPRLPRREP